MTKFIYALLFAALTLSSCGDDTKTPGEEPPVEEKKTALEEIDICGCAQVSLDMTLEVAAANGDEDVIRGIQESYQEDIDKCTVMGENLQKEMQGLSPDEQKIMSQEVKEIMEACDAYQELIKQY